MLLVDLARSVVAQLRRGVRSRAGESRKRVRSVAAYFDSPRITTFSGHLVTANNTTHRLLTASTWCDDTALVLAVARDRMGSSPRIRGHTGPLRQHAGEPDPARSAGRSEPRAPPPSIQRRSQQGIPLVVITTRNLSELDTASNLPPTPSRRITTMSRTVSTVIVPSQTVTQSATRKRPPGTTMIPTTGRDHRRSRKTASIRVCWNICVHPWSFRWYPGRSAGFAESDFPCGLTAINPQAGANSCKAGIAAAGGPCESSVAPIAHPGCFALLHASICWSGAVPMAFFATSATHPLLPETGRSGLPFPIRRPTHQTRNAKEEHGEAGRKPFMGTGQASSTVVSGRWPRRGAESIPAAFSLSSLAAPAATVVNSRGQASVGAGTVAVVGPAVAASVSGSDQYSVNGQGSLSFYGPAECSLGVSGDWTNYTATVTGNVSITLTTDGLTLNGQTLPAGTYTITTSSATLTGSGATSSPNFAGSVYHQCHGRHDQPRAGDRKSLRRRQAARSRRRDHSGRLHRNHLRLGQRRRHRCGQR